MARLESVASRRPSRSPKIPRAPAHPTTRVAHDALASDRPEATGILSENRSAVVDVDFARIERAVRDIIIAIGDDPDREGLRKTPARIARAYAELTRGLHIDPRDYLQTVFHEKYNQIVLLRNIPFHSICEHHFLPFVGHAHVAYLPRHKVVGLSKLARVVEGFALRPQVQERLTDQVADAIMDGLHPLGAICIMDASHTCMTIRGIHKPGTSMVTSAIRGVFVRNHATRTEVLNLIYGSAGL